MTNGDVFAVPECIFAEEFGIVDFDIFASIKAVIADQIEIPDIQVGTVHAEIIAACCDIIHFDVCAVPKRFGGLCEVHIVQFEAVYASQSLGCFVDAIGYRNVVRIPDAGSGHIEKSAPLNIDILAIPQGVFPLE